MRDYIAGERLTPDGPELEDIHRWLRTELSGNAFDVLSTRVIHEFERFLEGEEAKLAARHDGSPIETDFFGWLQGALAIPVINVAFGPSLLKAFPTFLDCLWRMDKGAWKLLLIPRIFGGSVLRDREELVKSLRIYLAEDADGEKMREGALGIVVGRSQAMKDVGFNVDQRARMLLPTFEAYVDIRV